MAKCSAGSSSGNRGSSIRSARASRQACDHISTAMPAPGDWTGCQPASTAAIAASSGRGAACKPFRAAPHLLAVRASAAFPAVQMRVQLPAAAQQLGPDKRSLKPARSGAANQADSIARPWLPNHKPFILREPFSCFEPLSLAEHAAQHGARPQVLMSPGDQCFRGYGRRNGERRRKSVRGCIVSQVSDGGGLAPWPPLQGHCSAEQHGSCSATDTSCRAFWR